MGTQDHRAMAFRATSQLLLRSTPMLQAAAQQRTGLLGVKCGMLTTWDEWGMPKPLTIVKVDNCQVSQVKTVEKEGYSALQLGAIDKKLKRANRPTMGHFTKAGTLPKRHVVEFRVSPDAVLPVGTDLFAAHFVAGQRWMLRAPARGSASQA